MDPKAALSRALRALQRGDRREAREALEDYWGWRSMGGWQPKGGDVKARHLAKRIGRATRAARAAKRVVSGIAGLRRCRFGKITRGARKGQCRKAPRRR